MNRRYVLSMGVSLVSLSLMVASSGHAWAQTQPATGEIALETVTVEGQVGSGTGPVNGYVPNRTTTGSKTDTPIEEIPQSVSVIGREEIEDRQAQKVDEALRYAAGVFAQPYGLDSDTDWFFIRVERPVWTSHEWLSLLATFGHTTSTNRVPASTNRRSTARSRTIWA